MSIHFPGRRASVCVTIALEYKPHNNKCSPHPHPNSLLSCYIWADITHYGISLRSVWSAVLTKAPPKILPTPNFLGEEGTLERQLWYSVCTAQQQPKQLCVTNTSADTRMNSSSAWPNTPIYLNSLEIKRQHTTCSGMPSLNCFSFSKIERLFACCRAGLKAPRYFIQTHY